MKKLFLIFPTDLYLDIMHYIDKNKKYDILLIEEITYFDRSITSTLNNISLLFNPLKPIYHRATMRSYWDKILNKIKNKDIKIKYIEFYKNWIDYVNYLIDQYDEIQLFDPVDQILENKIKKHLHINNRISYTTFNSPRFYLTRDEIESYDGALRNQSFYNWVRRTKNILMDQDARPISGKMSLDTENRMRPYKGIEHDIKIDKTFYKQDTKKYIDEAVQYIVKNIPYKNISIDSKCTEEQYIGAKTLSDLGLELLFPITHRESMGVLKDFFKFKINFFGDYQDIILNSDHSILFHSGISPMLNIGLITPDTVIRMALNYYDGLSSSEKKKELHNIEGFIRQIIGWREFCRMMYELHYDEIVGKNYFNQNVILDKKWYDADTGIPPVDKCIKKAFKYGYIHHIERLMVMGNIMCLMQITPVDTYKWFMEFSLDSYDWVMCYNVYCMATYSTGNFVTKPYISSSNYIIRMSNYKGDGKWDVEWGRLFWNFLKKHKKKIKKIPRLAMLLKNIK